MVFNDFVQWNKMELIVSEAKSEHSIENKQHVLIIKHPNARLWFKPFKHVHVYYKPYENGISNRLRNESFQMILDA